MNPAFTDLESILTMEAEHLPLWRAFLRTLAPLLVPGARILDFGCSRGGMLMLMFREGFGETVVGTRPGSAEGSGALSLGVGIDQDVPAMREVLAHAADAVRGRYPLLFTTGTPRGFPGQFDLVVSHEVVYLLPEITAAFADLHAALAPGGVLCVTTGCHTDNPLFPLWRASLRDLGAAVYERSTEEYERALHAAGFLRIERDRLRLSRAEYETWIRERGAAEPNPAWFPDASAERNYYTRTGKLLLRGWKD